MAGGHNLGSIFKVVLRSHRSSVCLPTVTTLYGNLWATLSSDPVLLVYTGKLNGKMTGAHWLFRWFPGHGTYVYVHLQGLELQRLADEFGLRNPAVTSRQASVRGHDSTPTFRSL